MNGWHLTLRSLCTQGGWSRPGSRVFCGWCTQCTWFTSSQGGRSIVVVSPLSPAEVERCPLPLPVFPVQRKICCVPLMVKASVTIFLPTGGEAEWNVQNWSSKQHCQGRIFARVPDRRAVTGT